MEIKKAVVRGLTSFSYAAAINVVLAVIIMFVVDKPGFIPVVPEFAARFSSGTEAFAVQCMLIGLTSMVFGAGSIILEIPHWSLVKQSVVYFLITTSVWLPVSVVCWGLGKYKFTFVSVTISYLIGYIISWSVQYKQCKKDIAAINDKLQELAADSFE